VAKKATFNFGANAKAKKSGAKKSSKSKGTKSGAKSNAWRSYVSAPAHSSAPIPD